MTRRASRGGRLLLIRHGESAGNRDRRFTPHPGVSLTDAGRGQVEAVARWIAGRYAPRAIVSSPYARARETADILGIRLNLEVTVEPDLRERSYGALAGQLYETPRPGYDPSSYWTWQPPGGESLEEVLTRAGATLDRLAVAGGVDDVVLVSHGAVMLALWRHVTGTWGEPRVVPNGGLLEVEHKDGVYRSARRVGPDAAGGKAWRR
jgi:broad specificity phosphatase PhoE